MRQINQTNNPKSDKKWRKNRKKLPTVPLFYRINTAMKQAKASSLSGGFAVDLGTAIIKRNVLEYKLRNQGLSLVELKKYTQLKKDIKLALLVQGVSQ